MNDTLLALGLFLFAKKHELYYAKRRCLMAQLTQRLEEIAERGPIPGSWFTSRFDHPEHNCRYTVYFTGPVMGDIPWLRYEWYHPRTGLRETNGCTLQQYHYFVRHHDWCPGSTRTLDSQ